MQKFPVSPASGFANGTEFPIYIKRCGEITIDEETPEIFFQLVCGNGGPLVVRGIDGNPIYYPSVAQGQIVPVVGTGVLSNATIDGTPVTTGASDIWWYGGI